jgi:hypothetical protein
MDKLEQDLNSIIDNSVETEEACLKKIETLNKFLEEVSKIRVAPTLKEYSETFFDPNKYTNRLQNLISNTNNAIESVRKTIIQDFYKEIEIKGYSEFFLTAQDGAKLCLLDAYRSDLKYFCVNKSEEGALQSNTLKEVGTYSRVDGLSNATNLLFLKDDQFEKVSLFSIISRRDPIKEVMFEERIQRYSIFVKKNDFENLKMSEEEEKEYEILVICEEFFINVNAETFIPTYSQVLDESMKEIQTKLNNNKSMLTQLNSRDSPDTTKEAEALTNEISNLEKELDTIQKKKQRFESIQTYAGQNLAVDLLKERSPSVYSSYRKSEITNLIKNAKQKLEALKHFKVNETYTSDASHGGKNRKRKTKRSSKKSKKSRRNRKR